jgi:hypothetical protein
MAQAQEDYSKKSLEGSGYRKSVGEGGPKKVSKP